MLPLKNFTSRGEVTRPQCSLIARHGGLCTRRSGWSSAQTWAAPSAARRCRQMSATSGEASDGIAGPVVSIGVPYRVQYGEVLRVVGSSSLLGDWSAERGLQLTWTEGDVWTAEVPIRAGHYEFKCIVYNTKSKFVARWEDGGNRVLDITEEPGKWEVACQWSATSDMTPTFTPALPQSPPSLEGQPADGSVGEPASTGETPTDGVSREQPLPAIMALKKASDDKQTLQVTSEEATSAAEEAPVAASSTAPSQTADQAGPSGSSLLLLATCAAGALAAAAALLAPGGFNTAATVSGRTAGEVVAQSSLDRAQLRSQLTALVGQVSSVPPGLRTQVSDVQGSVAAGRSSLQPMVQSGADLQSKAIALQSNTEKTATVDVAVAVSVEEGRVGSVLEASVGRRG